VPCRQLVGTNRIGVLDLVLEHGADVNERLQKPLDHSTEPDAKQEEASETPLHRAVKKKKAKPPMRWLLIINGADMNIKDCLGRSALDLAAGVERWRRFWSRIKSAFEPANILGLTRIRSEMRTTDVDRRSLT
jgi:hypothetical protein